ncbi:hypothetical protein OC834_005401 [Tilletia horrida]|nr:hypothetical protein OC834_005401 [Tilletia horrida]
MQSQRRELIRQLDVLLFTLFVYVWFLDKSLLLLALKIGLQVQYCNPSSFNPDLPLPILCRTVLFFNLAPIISHAFFWTGTGMSPLDDPYGKGIGGAYSRSGRTGFVLDFIGQAYQPTRFHLLLIDMLTAFLQWLFIIVVSETEKAEELRPDLDEYGPLDGSPAEELVLLEPDASRPSFRAPSSKAAASAAAREPSAANSGGEDDLSDAGSDAPLQPGRHAETSDASSPGVDGPAVPALFEQSTLRTRKRKGRRREGDTASDVNVGAGSQGRAGVSTEHGQGWSPRDEEASLFLPAMEQDGTEQRRPQGRVLLGQLARNTFTFMPVDAPSNNAAGVASVDNRPAPRADASSGLSRSERITPGGGGARAGRLVGSRLGIVPMFRRYNEGEEATITATGGGAQRPARPQRAPTGTIPVIALPFTAPTLRVSSFNGEPGPPAAGGATTADGEGSNGAGTGGQDDPAGRRPPGTPEENSWAWITRNFSVPQVRSGAGQRSTQQS